MIVPTVGRVVWYHERAGTFHQAAIIAAVLSDSEVHLMVIGREGTTSGRISVPLVQEGDTPLEGHYCEWMPYQKGQAAKTEALESKIFETAAAARAVV